MATTIKAGDSIDVEFSLNGADLTGFTCRMQVRDRDGEIAGGIDRDLLTLNTDSTSFIGRITPAETSSLNVGGYSISALISNSTTDESKELDGDFKVVKNNNY